MNQWKRRALDSRLAWWISSALISAGYAIRARQLVQLGICEAADVGLSDAAATSTRC